MDRERMDSPKDSAPEVRHDTGMRTRLREMGSTQRAVLVAVVFAGMAFSMFLVAPRSDLAAVPAGRLVAGIALFGLTGLAMALVLLRPMHRRPISAKVAWGIAIAALVLPLVFALLPDAHHERALHPESFANESAAPWSHSGRCLLFGALFALPVVASIVLVDRRERLETGRALQAAFAGGAAANLGLLLHCPLVSSGHLVSGHASIPVAVGAALFVWARWRSRSSADQ
jgi:hypothetical protein